MGSGEASKIRRAERAVFLTLGRTPSLSCCVHWHERDVLALCADGFAVPASQLSCRRRNCLCWAWRCAQAVARPPVRPCSLPASLATHAAFIRPATFQLSVESNCCSQSLSQSQTTPDEIVWGIDFGPRSPLGLLRLSAADCGVLISPHRPPWSDCSAPGDREGTVGPEGYSRPECASQATALDSPPPLSAEFAPAAGGMVCVGQHFDERFCSHTHSVPTPTNVSLGAPISIAFKFRNVLKCCCSRF
eukprot:COSAG02_NODE_7444_length_3010_cov_9.551013_3_plen_247_part_00